MRFFLICSLIVFADQTLADETETSLKRAIDAKWAECRSAIYKNEFKGEPLFEEDTYLSDDD